MKKSHTGRYGALITLVLMMSVGMVRAQPNDITTAGGQSGEEMIAIIKEPSVTCSTFMRSEYRYTENINGHRPATNGVMVAEDMRCRQCRGKCAADNLRCRSQCAGDSTCLAQCDERKSTCETICKQLFTCE